MKRMQPAMQEKTRYLSFRVHSDQDVELPELVNSFWDIAINFLGTRELSEASPWLIANKFDEEKQEGVVRINRDYEDEIRAALTLIEEFDEKEGFIEVTRVSGSLSGLT